jgi:hypothetical protein
MPPPKVFISYSHQDKAWLNRLVEHLAVSAEEADLDLWDDRRIAMGDEWLVEVVSLSWLACGCSIWSGGTSRPGLLGRRKGQRRMRRQRGFVANTWLQESTFFVYASRRERGLDGWRTLSQPPGA